MSVKNRKTSLNSLQNSSQIHRELCELTATETFAFSKSFGLESRSRWKVTYDLYKNEEFSSTYCHNNMNKMGS